MCVVTAAKKKPAKRKSGTKSKYDPEAHPLMAWMLAIAGNGNKEIAAGLGISTGTLWSWNATHAEFREVLHNGKGVANAKVAKALYNRCIGYRIPEKKVIQMPDGTIRKEVVEKEIIPDVAAIKFFLTNRDPDNWKEKTSTEVTGKDGKPLTVKVLKGSTSMEDL